MRVALLALCACNQVYDLSTTRVIDASPPDALPTTCPPPPVVPQFQHQLTQVLVEGCKNFSVDPTGKVAIATCEGKHMIGPPDGPLLLAGLTNSPLLTTPRPAPDGQRVYALRSQGPASFFEGYEKMGDMWRSIGTLPFTGQWLSNVAVGADGYERVLVEKPSGDVEEWMFKSGTWGMVGTFTSADLNTGTAFKPMITSDGLRIVVLGRDELGNSAMFFAARTSLADKFTGGQRLAEVPVSDDDGSYLSSDCTRIYISGLQQIFYLRQK